MNVRVPAAFVYIIIGEIRFLTFFVNISGKDDFSIQSKSLKSVLDSSDSAKRRGESDLPFRMRELAFSPYSAVTVKKISLSCDTGVLNNIVILVCHQNLK